MSYLVYQATRAKWGHGLNLEDGCFHSELLQVVVNEDTTIMECLPISLQEQARD